MSAPIALIQGASRGLGLEFCKHILKNKTPAAVIATCRNPEEAAEHSGIIVNLTAKVGSIGDNGLGGWYSYRMSIAALNIATRNLSIELGCRASLVESINGQRER